MTESSQDPTTAEAARGAFDALNRAGRNLPILDSAFFDICLKHFGSGRERWVMTGPSERPTGAALLRKIGLKRWETFQPSQAPLGSWVCAPDADLASVCKSLARTVPDGAAFLGLTQVDPTVIPRPAESGYFRTLDYIRTGRFRIEHGFDEYWQRRGSNLRQNMRKQRNRLDKEGRRVELRMLRTPEEMPSAIAAYAELEGKGWKTSTGTAVAPGNTQHHFYEDLFRAYAARGEALVLQFLIDGRAVASDLCLLRNRELIILKTTYDEAESKLSPALLMRVEALPQLTAGNQPLAVEFYGPMMDWHTKWSDEARTLYHANFAASSLIHWAQGAAARVRALLSNTGRSSAS